MTVIVLTVDQQSSRSTPDLVPEVLTRLNDASALGKPLRRFERTVGDEVQGILDSADATLSRLEMLIRDGRWSTGLGVADVDRPLPRSTRAGRGAAFLLARDAVTRAKQSPHRISVVGADDYRADQLETVLWLWSGVIGRRSARGWEVVDLLGEGLNHSETAERLGITQSAVSQRAQAAGLTEGRRAQRLAGQQIAELLGKEDQ